MRQTHSIWLAALAGLTLLRLILAGRMPLAPDETYYWLWSRHLQTGYFDHPPMVAIWIRIGTALAGQSPVGIRLLGPLSAAGGSIFLWSAAEDFCPDRHAGLVAAGLFNATLIAGVGAIIITPDTPLVFFWTAALAAIGRYFASRDSRWWAATGAAAGAALFSKYTAVFLVIAIAVWLITSREGRGLLRKPWPWIGLLLALLIFAPNIAWNASHEWVSYLKQGGRAAQLDLSRAAQFLAELVFGQIGLITPISFALMTAGLWRIWKTRDAAAQLLLWITLLPAAIFLQHTISDRVQANWPAIIYPSACIAASALPPATLARWLKPAMALGFVLTLLVYAQSAAELFPIPPARDPTALQLAGWNSFAAELATRHAAFITSDDYATASELAYYAPPGQTVAAFGRRWRYLNLPSAKALTGSSGILVTREPGTHCPNPLGAITRQARRGPISTYRICGITAPSNGVILPSPDE